MKYENEDLNLKISKFIDKLSIMIQNDPKLVELFLTSIGNLSIMIENFVKNDADVDRAIERLEKILRIPAIEAFFTKKRK